MKDPFQRILQEHPQVPLDFVKQLHGWLLKDDRRLPTETKRRGLGRKIADMQKRRSSWN